MCRRKAIREHKTKHGGAGGSKRSRKRATRGSSTSATGGLRDRDPQHHQLRAPGGVANAGAHGSRSKDQLLASALTSMSSEAERHRRHQTEVEKTRADGLTTVVTQMTNSLAAVMDSAAAREAAREEREAARETAREERERLREDREREERERDREEREKERQERLQERKDLMEMVKMAFQQGRGPS